MMNTFLTLIGACLLIAGAATFSGADAQGVGQWRLHMSRGHVRANGRCRGISYGTGARSCGTATGGPVGGLTSRN